MVVVCYALLALMALFMQTPIPRVAKIKEKKGRKEMRDEELAGIKLTVRKQTH